MVRVLRNLLGLVAISGFAAYSPISSAEWILYGPTTKSGMTTYYSSESVKSVEGYETVTVLKNFSTTQTVKYDGGAYIYKSIINRQVINCDKNEYATASVDMYRGLDGAGDVSSVYMKKPDWQPVKKGSIQEALTEQICKKI
jgi:hypothetical protein